MNRLITLFLNLAPTVALAGGLMLLLPALLHLTGAWSIPGVRRERRLPAFAALLLGIALIGLGGTFLLTEGRVGAERLYMVWLLLGAISAALAWADGRS